MNCMRLLRDMLAVCGLLPLFFALVNVEFLILYLLPFIPSFFIELLAKFLPFLIIPIVVTAVAAALYIWRAKSTGWRRYVSLNAIILVTFLLSSDLYKYALISLEVTQTPHDCVHIHSFAGSLHRMGEFAPAHAEMIINGIPYFWSYSERRFVKGEAAWWYNCTQATMVY